MISPEPTIQVELTYPEFDYLLPEFKHPGDAGMDLKTLSDFTLFCGDVFTVSTGIKVSIPEGFVGMVCPRSGLAAKQGVTVLNAPGIIDSGYRGEVGVVLYSTHNHPVHFYRGDRIAQLVVTPVCHPEIQVVKSLEAATSRGDGGFGSTGVQ